MTDYPFRLKKATKKCLDYAKTETKRLVL